MTDFEALQEEVNRMGENLMEKLDDRLLDMADDILMRYYPDAHPNNPNFSEEDYNTLTGKLVADMLTSMLAYAGYTAEITKTETTEVR